MPIHVLVGEDTHNIQAHIQKLSSHLQPLSATFNKQTFTDVQEGLVSALTLPMFDNSKVVIIRCNFSKLGDDIAEAIANTLPQLPPSTTLIFVTSSMDRRLKVAKLLAKAGTIEEFTAIPPWRLDLIEDALEEQAKAAGLRLTTKALSYLATAIGNDLGRGSQEVAKLATYAEGAVLNQDAVADLVPCMTQTNLQLAEAVRQGDAAAAHALLKTLLSRGEVPPVIVATLITQYRTWLWVKAALSDKSQRCSDIDIAQIAGIGNPKRLYFLRQEVAGFSIKKLAQSLTLLHCLDAALKGQGGKVDLETALLTITALKA